MGYSTMPRPRRTSPATDQVHGHTRLVALVDDVIIPMIGAGHLDQGFVRDLMQRLRGQFAAEYRKVERALAQRQHAANQEVEDA